jgi:hypothetical protein
MESLELECEWRAWCLVAVLWLLTEEERLIAERSFAASSFEVGKVDLEPSASEPEVEAASFSVSEPRPALCSVYCRVEG